MPGAIWEEKRRVCGARSEDGSAIAKGTEVVVTRYEKGIAYVRPWEEFTESAPSGPESFAKESHDVSSAPN